MDLERATEELYRVTPARFTSARDAMAAAARDAGQRELAASLKKLRKPSVGAWLANLLVSEQSSDVEHLVDLGAELRMPKRKVEGDQIRRVSKEKGDVVSKLVRDATSKASREGQSVSASAMLELEATLDAAFADPQAAEMLLQGHLSSGLHYSGLGFAEQPAEGSTNDAKKSASPPRATSAAKIAAQRTLAKAQHEAQEADAQLERARQAVTKAAEELSRVESAERQPVQRSREAHTECQRRSRSSPSSDSRARTRRMRRRRRGGSSREEKSTQSSLQASGPPPRRGHTGQRSQAPRRSPNPASFAPTGLRGAIGEGRCRGDTSPCVGCGNLANQRHSRHPLALYQETPGQCVVLLRGVHRRCGRRARCLRCHCRNGRSLSRFWACDVGGGSKLALGLSVVAGPEVPRPTRAGEEGAMPKWMEELPDLSLAVLGNRSGAGFGQSEKRGRRCRCRSHHRICRHLTRTASRGDHHLCLGRCLGGCCTDLGGGIPR